MIRAKVTVDIITLILVSISITSELVSADVPITRSVMNCSQLASTYLECIGPDHWAIPSPARAAVGK
jgi:hypothetical protein